MFLARDVITVGGATLLSRALAFLRDVLIAAALGAGTLADALFVALQIPNLFRRLLAEGALNAAFVPAWLRQMQEGGARAARRFGEDVLGTLAVLLAATSVLCLLFAPVLIAALAPGFVDERLILASYYLRLAAPYLALVGLAAVMATTLNAAGRVGAATAAPVVFNAVMIAAAAGVVALGLSNAPLAGAVLAAAMVVAGLAQLLIVAVALWRLSAAPRLPQLGLGADVRRFYRAVLPGVIAALIPQLTLIAGTVVASSSPAAVSWLTYAYRLYELPLGIVSVTIAAVMTTTIAAHVRAGDRVASATAQARALELALGLALPAAAGLALLAIPIVEALFERGAFVARDTAAVGGALAAIAIGIPGHALEKVLASVSFAHDDARTPMLTALTGLFVAAVAAVLLFPSRGHVGVALAIATCGWVSALLLGIVLLRRQWLHVDAGFWRRMGCIVLATAAMGTIVAGLRMGLLIGSDEPASSIRSPTVMAVLVVGGLAVYVGLLRLLGVVVIDARHSRDRNDP
ncbi:MAG: murein biosynthesis integral membrane protein MurJ [Hyphomicrobiales bacterium]|nr:murein biosynthesis integral membrane protein MurJ [Hyphomicrobiales bacterium]